MTDRFDDVLREAAKSYHEPPPTPREEIWQRIEQARRMRAGQPPIDLVKRRRRWLRFGPPLALAATLVLGVAIGRLTLSDRPAAAPAGTEGVAATPVAPEPATASPSLASRVAAAQHLTRIEALLVDYETGRIDASFDDVARELLVRTRLWLDAGASVDPELRRLFEDLELLLVQIAQLPSHGPAEERALIDDGMAERQIRPRLRSAIPTGPAT